MVLQGGPGGGLLRLKGTLQQGNVVIQQTDLLLFGPLLFPVHFSPASSFLASAPLFDALQVGVETAFRLSEFLFQRLTAEEPLEEVGWLFAEPDAAAAVVC